MTQGSVYAMAVVPTEEGDGWPVGIAVTSLVSKAFTLEEVSAFALSLHRGLADGKHPLEVHWPPPQDGFHWLQVDDNLVPSNLPWWASYIPPANPAEPNAPRLTNFVAYSRPEMEKFIAIFDSQFDLTPTFRTVTYPMNVTQLSISGLRFKVNNSPEMWVLAWQTQAKP